MDALRTPSGHAVHYGRCAKENDALCTRANQDDLWFHVSEYPGSHCLLVLPAASPPVSKGDLLYVATLAKQRSKAKLLPRVAVHYCPFRQLDIDWDSRKRRAGEVVIRGESRVVWV